MNQKIVDALKDIDIGLRLKAQRVSLNLSQESFAKACGCSLSAQKRYEVGDRSPDAKYLRAASEIGCDVLFVITGESR